MAQGPRDAVPCLAARLARGRRAAAAHVRALCIPHAARGPCSETLIINRPERTESETAELFVQNMVYTKVRDRLPFSESLYPLVLLS